MRRLISIVRRFICFAWCFFMVVLGFNLDSTVPIVRIGPKNAYFGFSIAQHQIKGGNSQHVVVVGAPHDVGTSSRFVKPGAVYQCPLLNQNGQCSRLDIDKYEDDSGSENKTDQWLGVSVASPNSAEGKAMACAHRHRKTGKGPTGYVYGQGICFLLDNDLSEIEPLEPCNAKPKGKGDDFQYLVCQAGTSSAIDQGGRILVGSPGPHNWRGTAFKYELPDTSENKEDDNTTYIRSFSYLGMSTRIGSRLFRDGKPGYVIGAPRSQETGEIFIFKEGDKNLTVVRRILGPKFYSGFGHDILVGDFNGDKRDDLIVGAPFFYEPGISGAIYIYFNSPEWELSARPIRITNRAMKDAECKQLNCHDARFGFSLANIGDLNKDGMNDFVVGAPFEGNGAIYIFHGSATSKIGSYSQRISAQDVAAGTQLRSFGYSMSGGGDIDSNSYPDLAVGSYQSDTITILRSRPVIGILGSLESNPKQMDPKVTNCSDGKPVNCLRISVCLKMKAEPKDKFTQPINVRYRLEAEKFTGASVVRVYFGDNAETYFTEAVVPLQPHDSGAPVCREHAVYLRPKTKDFYNAIAFRVTYQLPDTRAPTPNPNQRPPEFYSYPILNASTTSTELQVPFIKNCGKDDICNSSLKLSVNVGLPKVNGEYELNLSGESQLIVNASVTNYGEDAHAAVLRVTLPPDVFLIRILPKELSCIPAENILECELGNPVAEGQTVSIQIVLNPNKLSSSQNRINIAFAVNTTSAEKDTSDDVVNVDIKVSTVIDLSVIGSSDPRNAYFTPEHHESLITHEEHIGQELLHKFEVRNIGATVASKSLLTIIWPFRRVTSSTESSYILYIMERPTVQGNTRELEGARCQIDEKYINPLNIIKTSSLNPDSLRKSQSDQDQRPQRTKRSATDRAGIENTICGESSTIECISIECDVEELRAGESAVVKIRARLWNRTLAVHFADKDEFWVTSTAIIRAIVGSGSNIRDSNATNDFGQAATRAINSQTPKGVPIWIILLAVLAGILLLVIVTIALWKVGFFARKRPEFSPEQQAAFVRSGDSTDGQDTQ